MQLLEERNMSKYQHQGSWSPDAMVWSLYVQGDGCCSCSDAAQTLPKASNRSQTLPPPLSCANDPTVRGRRGRQSLQSRTEAESSDQQFGVTVVETVNMTEVSGPAPSAAAAEPKRCSLIGCHTLFVIFWGAGRFRTADVWFSQLLWTVAGNCEFFTLVSDKLLTTCEK